MAANDPNSPRQKMINLMYLVFIAMLALNVSSEVLDGFELVEESLLRSVKASTSKNDLVFQDLETYHTSNPEKTKIWYDYAEQVKQKSDSLFNYIQDLKVKIVKRADGKDGDPENLEHPDDLNASFEVMFEAGKNDGEKLRKNIDDYRVYMTSLIRDTVKQQIIENNLSTVPSRKAKENKQNWEESMFSKMPMAAAVTLLTKMQNDIRYAEGEVLNVLLKSIDIGDSRVNKIQAYVVPESKVVMRGTGSYADIILAAEDTTLLPKVYIDGLGYLPESAHGRYQMPSGSIGPRTLKGHIEMQTQDGPIPFPFNMDYIVIEPAVSISPKLMNVLYRGIENEISIAAPGVPSQNITATMTNGTITRRGDLWVAVPSVANQDAIISVSAKVGASTTKMGERPMRVRALPDPTAFFEFTDQNGTLRKFKGGRIPKAQIVGVESLKASIDDGILNINFNVVKFETIILESMGTTTREISDGANFSQRQKDAIRRLTKGKSFFIRGIAVRGPGESSDREIGVLEVIVN